jgi:hypothetical protein
LDKRYICTFKRVESSTRINPKPQVSILEHQKPAPNCAIFLSLPRTRRSESTLELFGRDWPRLMPLLADPAGESPGSVFPDGPFDGPPPPPPPRPPPRPRSPPRPPRPPLAPPRPGIPPLPLFSPPSAATGKVRLLGFFIADRPRYFSKISSFLGFCQGGGGLCTHTHIQTEKQSTEL